MIDEWDGRGAEGVPDRRLVAAELGGDARGANALVRMPVPQPGWVTELTVASVTAAAVLEGYAFE